MTDANVVLGFSIRSALAGGGLPIRRELAERRRCRQQVASPLGPVARGRRVGRASRRQRDDGAGAARRLDRARPRSARSAMLAFGGNGPVHAATLARLLDIRRSWCRRCPGLFSALGMLFPEVEHHYVRTCKQRLDASTRRARGDLRAASRTKAPRRSRPRASRARRSASSAWSTCAMPAPTPS